MSGRNSGGFLPTCSQTVPQGGSECSWSAVTSPIAMLTLTAVAAPPPPSHETVVCLMAVPVAAPLPRLCRLIFKSTQNLPWRCRSTQTLFKCSVPYALLAAHLPSGAIVEAPPHPMSSSSALGTRAVAFDPPL
jgi:hypothetical protein